MSATVILGPEHDPVLGQTLLNVLLEAGAEMEAVKWAVGGSQEIILRRVKLNGQRLTVRAETYIGLSLTGDRSTVEMIAECVRQRLAS